VPGHNFGEQVVCQYSFVNVGGRACTCVFVLCCASQHACCRDSGLVLGRSPLPLTDTLTPIPFFPLSLEKLATPDDVGRCPAFLAFYTFLLVLVVLASNNAATT
jgi:hypothetical protein